MIGHGGIAGHPISGLIASGSTLPLVDFADDIATRQETLIQPWPWIEFYDIETEGSGTLYYVDFQDPDAGGALPTQVPFNGNQYNSRKIKRDAIKNTGDGLTQLGVHFEDPTGDLKTILRTEDGMIGASVKISLIPYDLLDETYLATVETYRVRASAMSSNPDTVSLELGLPSLSDIQIPVLTYQRTRCFNDYNRRFETDSYCRAPSDDFEIDTRQVMGSSANSALVPGTWPAAKTKRRFGWNSMNADIADSWVTSFVISSAYPTEQFTRAESLVSDQRWEDANFNAMLMYKVIAGDFDLETHVRFPTNVRDERFAGIFAGSTTDDGETIIWGNAKNAVGTTVLRRRVTTSSVSTDTDDTDLSDGEERFRMTRVGDVFTMYVKPSDTGAWVQKQQTTKALGASINLGLVTSSGVTGEATKVAADFRFFRFAAGGFVDCDRSIEDCRERENEHQFNGFGGLPHQRQRI